MTPTKPHILVVDDDPFNLKLVTTTLERSGEYKVSALDNPTTALKQLRVLRPDMIISDVLMPDMDGFEFCGKIRKNPGTTDTPVILLTSLDDVEQKIKGFESGADDYIEKPFDPVILIARVNSLMRRSMPVTNTGNLKETRTGKVIALFSLRGGVGVSSLSTNVAVALAQLWQQPAVLVDLVLTAGQSALLLNLPLRHTWVNLAQMPVTDIDLPYLSELLLRHKSGARILAAPGRAEEGELIDSSRVAHVITLLKARYNYVVLDLPHDFHETTLAGLDSADEILVVLTPEIAAVRATTLLLDALKSSGLGGDNVHLLLNRVSDRGNLPRKDIEAALHRRINLVSPFAPDQMNNAINLGVPVVYDQFNTPIGAFIEDTAFWLSQDDHKRTKPEQPSKAWQRVARRMSQKR